MKAALKGADAVVLAVKHQAYRDLDPDKIVKMTGRPFAIIDCFGLLDDAKIRRSCRQTTPEKLVSIDNPTLHPHPSTALTLRAGRIFPLPRLKFFQLRRLAGRTRCMR